MRLIASEYGQSYMTAMTAFEILDMGQWFCTGMDGSYNGNFDTGLIALSSISSPSPSAVGLVVSTMEQAVRLYCPEYVNAWKAWSGREPFDPFQ